MPLVRIDAVKGRTKKEVNKLLDASHRAVLSAFKVPLRDHYQIYNEHPASHLVVKDTGLGIARTHKILVFTVISKPRTDELKQQFYKDLCHELRHSCGVDSNDVVVSIVTNSAADWSFGNGKAQFITGEL